MARPQTATPKGPQAGFGMPLYILIQLRALAIRQGCSLRFLMLKAVQSIGVHVEPADLVADKRQARPRGTRTNYARKASGKNERT